MSPDDNAVEWGETPIAATVLRGFDLGLVVRCDDGEERQLRMPEMNPAHQKLHCEGRDSELIGQSLLVHVLCRPANRRRVSEITPQEYRRLRQIERRERQAREEARLGQTYRMRIESCATSTNEIYYGVQVDGYLAGAIPTVEIAARERWPSRDCWFPTSSRGSAPLHIKQVVEVVIVAFTPWGGPYFGISRS